MTDNWPPESRNDTTGGISDVLTRVRQSKRSLSLGSLSSHIFGVVNVGIEFSVCKREDGIR